MTAGRAGGLCEHCSQNKPTTRVTRVAADSAAASTALQPLLILDYVIAQFEFKLIS